MKPIHEIHGKHATAEIHYDDSSPSPREWDNLGTIVAVRGGYDFGDERADDLHDLMLSLLMDFDRERATELEESYNYPEAEADYSQEDVEDAIEAAFLDHYAALGVWMRGRGGVSAGSGFVGCDGIAYVAMRDAWTEAAGTQPNDEAVRKWAERNMAQEVEAYEQWIDGEVYGIVIRGPDGEVEDSCWGFYGDPFDDDGYIAQEARDMLAHVDKELDAHYIHDPDNMTPFGGRHGQYA